MTAPEVLKLADDTERRGKLTRWKPKKWQPEYERMVYYSVLGESNVSIAKRMGYTPVHVSNVLNLEKAEELRNKLMEAMRASTVKSVEELMEKAGRKTVERLNEVLEDSDRFASTQSALAIIDRGMEVLKGLGKLKGAKTVDPNAAISVGGNAIIFQGSAVDEIGEGLRKANQVRDLHPIAVVPKP